MEPRRRHGDAVPPAISPTTTVIVADPGWWRLMRRPDRLAARAATAAGGAGSVMLSSDRHLRALNLRFRGRNKPTNVLSFPGNGGGDLVIALGVVRREATAQGRRPADHLAHLVVHGVLHLHGADHGAAGAARRMELRETRVLHRLRVPNPWRRG